MFCLPQSTAFCTSGSPGSDSCGLLRELLAGGDLRGELRRPGLAAAWPAPAAPGRPCTPWSEPATASHTVFEPPAGSDTV